MDGWLLKQWLPNRVQLKPTVQIGGVFLFSDHLQIAQHPFAQSADCTMLFAFPDWLVARAIVLPLMLAYQDT